jgi:hypothetical protein
MKVPVSEPTAWKRLQRVGRKMGHRFRLSRSRGARDTYGDWSLVDATGAVLDSAVKHDPNRARVWSYGEIAECFDLMKPDEVPALRGRRR